MGVAYERLRQGESQSVWTIGVIQDGRVERNNQLRSKIKKTQLSVRQKNKALTDILKRLESHDLTLSCVASTRTSTCSSLLLLSCRW